VGDGSSDGGIGMRHPRAAGTFPRVLGRFVREEKWLSLPEGVRKITSWPASRLGLKDRGIIRAGMKADLVLFDPQDTVDQSTFDDPQRLSRGVARVFVNGVEVWAEREGDGREAGSRAGALNNSPKEQKGPRHLPRALLAKLTTN
jgi:N-acyl-D-amino-acid deacylase